VPEITFKVAASPAAVKVTNPLKRRISWDSFGRATRRVVTDDWVGRCAEPDTLGSIFAISTRLPPTATALVEEAAIVRDHLG